MIGTVIPRTAVGHKLPLALPILNPTAGLHANLSARALDYCARQKLSGASIIFSAVKQLPVLPPRAYDGPVPWEPKRTLAEWVTERVLELSYTAWDLQPYARDLGDDGPPFRWDEARRGQLRAALDAADRALSGLDRGGAAHVPPPFLAVRTNGGGPTWGVRPPPPAPAA